MATHKIDIEIKKFMDCHKSCSDNACVEKCFRYISDTDQFLDYVSRISKDHLKCSSVDPTSSGFYKNLCKEIHTKDIQELLFLVQMEKYSKATFDPTYKVSMGSYFDYLTCR